MERVDKWSLKRWLSEWHGTKVQMREKWHQGTVRFLSWTHWSKGVSWISVFSEVFRYRGFRVCFSLSFWTEFAFLVASGLWKVAFHVWDTPEKGKNLGYIIIMSLREGGVGLEYYKLLGQTYKDAMKVKTNTKKIYAQISKNSWITTAQSSK